jgi:3-oxoacyl-[acyl-carrier protein] reductase
MRKGRLEGKIALITGAGSPRGIGFATAKIFAEEGATLAITSTTSRINERVDELKSLKTSVIPYIADLTSPEQTNRMISEILKAFGRIDILVNNAGIAPIGSPVERKQFADQTKEEWDRKLDINLQTTFNAIKAVLPNMLSQQYGRIVNVSSVTGPIVSNPGSTAYSAAKSAILGLTRSLAIEVAKSNIMVNAVAPGWIETDAQTEGELEGGRNTPIGRPGRPEEVGHLIAFLASKESSYITGELVVIDGGNTLQEYKGSSELYY